MTLQVIWRKLSPWTNWPDGTLAHDCCASIETVKHKGVRRLYEKSDRSRIRTDLVEEVRKILSALAAARKIGSCPYSVAVKANGRSVFTKGPCTT